LRKALLHAAFDPAGRWRRHPEAGRESMLLANHLFFTTAREAALAFYTLWVASHGVKRYHVEAADPGHARQDHAARFEGREPSSRIRQS
jgi:hypothetical protein